MSAAPHHSACFSPSGHPDVRDGFCPTPGGWVRPPAPADQCPACLGTGEVPTPLSYNGVSACYCGAPSS